SALNVTSHKVRKLSSFVVRTINKTCIPTVSATRRSVATRYSADCSAILDVGCCEVSTRNGFKGWAINHAIATAIRAIIESTSYTSNGYTGLNVGSHKVR